MSTLTRCLWRQLSLCLLLAATPLSAEHSPGQTRIAASLSDKSAQISFSTRRTPRPECNLTGTCGKRPIATICRENGPCIPVSRAWSATGPLATKSQKPGGFPGLMTPPPLPVPLPLPGLLLASALWCLRRLTLRKSGPSPN